MKKLFLLGFLFLSFALAEAQSRIYKVEDIPLVHLKDARRYVSNPDGILSPAVVSAIDSTLYALEHETGIQTLVVAVGQIEGTGKRNRTKRDRQRVGRPARYRRTMHTVCHRIRNRRRPA